MHQRAAARAAGTDPLALAVAMAVVVAAVVLGVGWLFAVAALAYAALAVLTYAERVGSGDPAAARVDGPATANGRHAARATPPTLSPDVSQEVDALVLGVRRAAARTQRLHAQLAAHDDAALRQRLSRAGEELEHVTVTLRGIRARLPGPPGSGEAADPTLAGEVRQLRRRVDALARDLGA